MASFNPQKIELSQINGGVRYENGDGLQAESINNAIEASAFAQSLATNQPDTSGASEVGTPSVTITYGADGTPRFSFKSLKGIKGDSGVGDAKLLNEVGESDTDGYTQKTTNSLISNPNLLINGDFRVNQRGKVLYSTQDKYCVDRWWIIDGTLTVSPVSNGIECNNFGTLAQYLEQTDDLTGKPITMSVSVDGTVYSKSYIASKSMGIHPFVIDGFGEARFSYSNLKNTYYAGLYPNSTQNSTNTPKIVNWVKLEVGSIATQFSPRPYAEELAMCQRYYQVFKNPTKFLGYTDGTTYAKAIIPTIAKMRDNPTVSMSSKGQVIVGNSGYEIGLFSFNSYSGNNLILSLLLISTVSSSFALYESSSSITLDAEIY